MIKVDTTPVNKIMTVPTSKSYSARLLILAATIEREIQIDQLSNSTDVTTLVDCLQKIGIIFNGDIVINSFPSCEKIQDSKVELYSGDGGTTNRFLLALLSKGTQQYRLYPDVNFLKRPLRSYVDLLKSLGAKVVVADNYIDIQGPIGISAPLVLEQMESGQFISALKLVFWNKDIAYENVNNSKKYLEMTDHLIDQLRKGMHHFAVPVDFSSLSYPLILAATKGDEVLIDNCYEQDEYQADSIIVEIMKRIGAEISFSERGLFLKGPKKLKPFCVDAKVCPDLIPGLAFLASCCNGRSELNNLSILRWKESDRFHHTEMLLKMFGVKYEKTDTSIIIFGPTCKSTFKHYSAPSDHRMIMSAYLFMKMHSGGEIENSSHVQKSFPDFFRMMCGNFVST